MQSSNIDLSFAGPSSFLEYDESVLGSRESSKGYGSLRFPFSFVIRDARKRCTSFQLDDVEFASAARIPRVNKKDSHSDDL